MNEEDYSTEMVFWEMAYMIFAQQDLDSRLWSYCLSFQFFVVTSKVFFPVQDLASSKTFHQCFKDKQIGSRLSASHAISCVERDDILMRRYAGKTKSTYGQHILYS